MRCTAGFSLLDKTRNEVRPLKKKLVQYKQKWLHHVSKMEDIRYPKQLPVLSNRRRPKQLLKRLLDGYNCEAESGHLLA